MVYILIIMYMYVNKRVELALAENSTIEMYVLLLYKKYISISVSLSLPLKWICFMHFPVKSCHENLKVPITCKIRVFTSVEKTIKYAKMLEAAGCQVRVYLLSAIWFAFVCNYATSDFLCVWF